MASPCSTPELLDFLVAAKRATYAAAGDNASNTALLAGTKQLEYGAGGFFYRDIYAGLLMFAGQEIVYFRDTPLWSMTYCGGTLPTADMAEARDIYAFLRQALCRVTRAHPFRGPRRFGEAEFLYTNAIQGNIERFHGIEHITTRNTLCYELHYSGGLLI
ncbi:MAG: DUF5680 domain-containing protein [Betaproteobacteria bacterium]